MTNEGRDIKNHKKRGEWAELQFMARAAEHGLNVARPWGDSQRYDVGIEYKGRLLRVQVKCTIHKHPDGLAYVSTTRGHNGCGHYTRAQIDFLAVYIAPEDIWYIFPSSVSTTLQWSVYLRPHWKGHKYERYREAWELLRGKKRRARAASAP